MKCCLDKSNTSSIELDLLTAENTKLTYINCSLEKTANIDLDAVSMACPPDGIERRLSRRVPKVKFMKLSSNGLQASTKSSGVQYVTTRKFDMVINQALIVVSLLLKSAKKPSQE